jgi:UDP-glucose 4-epimerase
LLRENLLDCDLIRIIEEGSFDVINHHAAQVNVRMSLRDPEIDCKQNVVATVRLLHAALMAKKPVERFIFASSGGAIYGAQQSYPTKEAAPLKPESPYGVAKLAAENYVAFFARTYRLKAVTLRYANVYGPRQDPNGEAGVVAIFADAYLRGKTPVIFGDGAQTRDFVYVKDVARANVAALTSGAGQIFNISTGSETSVNEMAHMIQAIIKSEAAPTYASPIPGELERSCLDNSLALRDLDWSPRTNLETGLAETIQSLRS